MILNKPYCSIPPVVGWIRQCIHLGVGLLGWVCVAAHASPLDQAKLWFHSGSVTKACRLLETIENQYLGQEDFDALYAQCASDAHHWAVAQLALERVLMNHPDDHQVRLALAKLAIQQNDLPHAKAQLNHIAKDNPLESIHIQVAQLLAQIRKSGPIHTVENHVYLNLGLGGDDNINGAADYTVMDPVYTEFKAIRSYYYQVSLGFYGNQNLTPHLSWYWQVDSGYDEQINHDWDKNGFTMSGGLAVHFGKWLLRLPGYYHVLRLDGTTFQQTGFMGLSLYRTLWHHRLQLGGFVEHGFVGYPPNPNPNVDTDVGGLSALYQTPSGHTLLQVKAYATDSDSSTPNRTNYENNQRYNHYDTGLEGSVMQQISPKHVVVIKLLHRRQHYQWVTESFGTVRSDKIQSITTSWYWNMHPDLMWGVHYTQTENRSNQALYDHNRHAVWVSGRYFFN